MPEPQTRSQCEGKEQTRRHGIAAHPPPQSFEKWRGARMNGLAVQVAAEVGSQIKGTYITPARIFLQAFQTDPFEVFRQSRAKPARRKGIVGQDLLNRLECCCSLEWRPPGEQIVQDCPQSVDIRRGAGCGCLPAGLLGSHI